MNKALVFLTLSSICIAFTPVYAGDGTGVPPVVSTIRINHPLVRSNIARPNLALDNSDIRSQFLFATVLPPDLLKNMAFRSAAAGAGILGAVMGGKIAAKFWLSPHVCFAPGIDIGSKRADFRLTF